MRPAAAAFLPASPTVFLHGFGGRGDKDGSFAETLDYAVNTLGWVFGGRFCLPGTGINLTPRVDVQFSGATTRAATDATFGPYGNNNCAALNPATTPLTTGDFFTVDFGNNFAAYGTGANDGLVRQANSSMRSSIRSTIRSTRSSIRSTWLGRGRAASWHGGISSTRAPRT